MTCESEGVGSPPTGGIPVLPRSRDIFYSLLKAGFEVELSVFSLLFIDKVIGSSLSKTCSDCSSAESADLVVRRRAGRWLSANTQT